MSIQIIMSVFVAVYRSTFFKIGSGVTVAKIISQVHRMSLFVPHVFLYLYCVKILCQADHTSLYICATRLYVFVLPEDLVDAWIDKYIHAMPHVAGGPTVAQGQGRAAQPSAGSHGTLRLVV